MATLKAAFVGAGPWGNRRHYPSVTSMPDVELAALCDIDEARAKETAERWDVPRVYSDYRQMFEKTDPEIVYVIMSPWWSYEIAAAALRQGRSVYCEQPPFMSINEIRMLAHIAEEHGCKTMVSFQRRFIPAITEMKRRVEERGPVHTASVDFFKVHTGLSGHGSYTGAWEGRMTLAEGDATHVCDDLRYLCGGDVVDVMTTKRSLYSDAGFNNSISAVVEFSTGAVGRIHFCFATGRRVFRAEIHGKNCYAYVDAEGEATFASDDGPEESFRSSDFRGELSAEQENHWLGFWHAHRHFLDSIHDNQQPLTNFEDAIKTRELVELIERGGKPTAAFGV